ncbi:Uncharacterised protein [Mycobacterium tuberculosis]|uniref:Uncharacterized protein n=1 Tax=Mycobacterium tuberculosis TaxID=1773 RepID=A0A655APC3_MYCTX|nr:Uncharacterised protein [Mycobacterium tuberculosis]
MAGRAAGLRRVLQLLVHRHLRAAVRVPRRLSGPADDRARPQPAGYTGRRPAQPGPAAQARPRPAGRRARRPGRHHHGPAARLAQHHPATRRQRGSLRREGLPARVRQPGVPLRAAGSAGGGGRRQAVRLRGQRDRDSRRRTRFLFGVAGRVRLVSRRQHRRRHVVAPDLCAGQQLPSALPAVRAGHLVRRRHRLSGRPGHC